jgi:hypothetical protein
MRASPANDRHTLLIDGSGHETLLTTSRPCTTTQYPLLTAMLQCPEHLQQPARFDKCAAQLS